MSEDSREMRVRLMLYRILGLHAEQIAPLIGGSAGDTHDALLSLVRDGYVRVATDREGFRLELTEKGLAHVERR